MSAGRSLDPQIVLIVLGAGVLHAVWNALAKHVEDRLLAFALIGLAAGIGGTLVLIVAGLPARAALPFVITSAVVHVLYELALMNSYRLGAFNQTYPIARGTSPLVVALGAYVFAGERLPLIALAGVAVLSAGLIVLAASSGRLARADAPAIGAAVLTGLTIAAYTLIDGIGVRHAHNPYGYGGLLFLLQAPPLPLALLARRPRAYRAPVRILARGLGAGVLSLIAYGGVLWAQTKAPLAEVAALRETSVISAALIGALFFREGFGGRRLAAATLVATGIVLIAV